MTEMHKSAVNVIVIIFVIALIILSTVYITIIMSYNEMIQDSIKILKQVTAKSQENFTVNIKLDDEKSNKLLVYGTNLGSTPLEIGDIFVIDDTTHAVNYIEVDYRDSLIPVGSQVQLLEHQSVTLIPGNYRVKVVTSNGNMEIISFSVQGSNNGFQVDSGG